MPRVRCACCHPCAVRMAANRVQREKQGQGRRVFGGRETPRAAPQLLKPQQPARPRAHSAPFAARNHVQSAAQLGRQGPLGALEHAQPAWGRSRERRENSVQAKVMAHSNAGTGTARPWAHATLVRGASVRATAATLAASRCGCAHSDAQQSGDRMYGERFTSRRGPAAHPPSAKAGCPARADGA